MEGLLGFILAGFALAGSPGPATLSLAATGAAFGARRGFGYMLVNPKAYAAMAALFSGFALVRERLVLDDIAKAAVIAAIIILVNLAWLFAGAALTRSFRAPGPNRDHQCRLRDLVDCFGGDGAAVLSA